MKVSEQLPFSLSATAEYASELTTLGPIASKKDKIYINLIQSCRITKHSQHKRFASATSVTAHRFHTQSHQTLWRVDLVLLPKTGAEK